MFGVPSSQGELEMDPVLGAPRPGESQAHNRWVSVSQGDLGSWRVHTGPGDYGRGHLMVGPAPCGAQVSDKTGWGSPIESGSSAPRLRRCQEDLGDTCPWRAPICATHTCWKTGLFAGGLRCGTRGGE